MSGDWIDEQDDHINAAYEAEEEQIQICQHLLLDIMRATDGEYQQSIRELAEFIVRK